MLKIVLFTTVLVCALLAATLLESVLGIAQTRQMVISHIFYMSIGAGSAMLGVWTRK